MSQITFPSSISWTANFIEYPGLDMQNGVQRQSNILFSYLDYMYSTKIDISNKDGIFSKYQTNSFAIYDLTTKMTASNTGKIKISTTGIVDVTKSSSTINCIQTCEIDVSKDEDVVIKYRHNNPGVTLSLTTDIIPRPIQLSSLTTNLIVASNQRKKVNFNIPGILNNNKSSVIISSFPKYGQIYFKSEYAILNNPYSLDDIQDIYYKSIQGIGYDEFNYKYVNMNERSADCTVNVVVYPTDVPNMIVSNQYFKIREGEAIINKLEVQFESYKLMDAVPLGVPGPRIYWSLQTFSDIVTAQVNEQDGTVTANGVTTGQTTLKYTVIYGSLDQSITANGKILVDVLRGAVSAPAVAGGTIGIFVGLIAFAYLGYYTYHKYFAKNNEEKVLINLRSGRESCSHVYI
eukprot:NODE_911_length_3153_cov_0.222659.p1 type:complete len:404 gc:universal NODE_911_length_3153_cov_0.222659:1127-2338(+)